MEERLICCCGAGGWAKVIGWLEVAASVVLIILSSVILGYVGVWTIDDIRKIFGPDVTPEQVETMKTAMFIVLSIGLVISVIGLLMAFILLKGSYQKDIRLLRAWLVYAIIIFSIGAVGAVLGAINTGPNGISIKITLPSISLCIRAFYIWVVHRHKKEVEAQYFILQPDA